MWEQVWFFLLCGFCNYLPLCPSSIPIYTFPYFFLVSLCVYLSMTLDIYLLRVFLFNFLNVMSFLVLIWFLDGSLLVFFFLGWMSMSVEFLAWFRIGKRIFNGTIKGTGIFFSNSELNFITTPDDIDSTDNLGLDVTLKHNMLAYTI